jgi:hypothetical protein
MLALFGDAQGVHIRAQRNAPIAATTPERADYPSSSNTFRDFLHAEFPKLCSDKGCGALLFETEFWSGMEAASPRDHVPSECIDINLGHDFPRVAFTFKIYK